MSSVTEGFTHGAGFTPHAVAVVVAVLGMIVTTAWFMWVNWSVFRGLKSDRTDKAKFQTVLLRTAFVWLLMQYLLFTSVIDF